MSIFLGIDVGTSGTKTLAIDERGKILAQATADYPIYHAKPLWSEQDPEDWWQATVKTVRAVVRQGKFKPADVKAIGLSGQMHGSVFLDKRDRVVRRAILWNDGRTAAECQEIEDRAGGRAALIGMVANPALTGFTAPKILWLRNHEPKNFDKTAKVLLPKDEIRRRLTGVYASEMSDASGMLLLDVKNRRWSSELLGKLDLDRSLLGDLYESEQVTGQLTPDAAKLLGLSTACVVVGGAGDCAAGAVGNGIVSRGVLSTSIGTSGVMFVHSDQVQVDPLGRLHTFCHAVHGKWHLMGVNLSSGGCLQWFRNQLCQADMAAAKRAKRRSLRNPHRRGRADRSRKRRTFLPSLSVGRADAACRPQRPRGVCRTDEFPHPRPRRPGDSGRRNVRPARQPGDHSRSRRAGRPDSRLGRRLAQPPLAANPGRRLWPKGRHAQRRGRPGLWCGAFGRGRRRRLQKHRRSLRRHDARHPANGSSPHGGQSL